MRLASINTEAFYDLKTGIKKLAAAEESMGFVDCMAFFRHSTLNSKIETLESEIAGLRCKNLQVDEKINDLIKLSAERDKAKEENRACLERIRSQRVIPIINKIREKLKEFTKLRGYALVIESTSIFWSSTIGTTDFDDITPEFVRFCNDFFERENKN